jgi:hypothetical protein
VPHCFRVAAFIFNTSAKYEVNILSLCDATTFFTSSVETKCGKEIYGPNKHSVHQLAKESDKNVNRNLHTTSWYNS